MSDCPFCEILAGNAPAEVIDEDNESICIVPLNPVVDGHLLVIPREHAQYIWQSTIPVKMLKTMALYGANYGDGCNVIQSNGVTATQTVPHVHFHIVPRTYDDGLHLPWTGQDV